MEFSKTFSDAAGREWTVDISLANARRMRDIAGVTLEELAPELSKDAKDLEAALAPVQSFLGDPLRAFDAFFALVKPAADKAGLTKEQVEEAFDEPTREKMNIAFLRGIYDFFRWNSARQGTVRVIAQHARTLMAKVEERMTQTIDAVDTGKILDALPAIDADKLNADLADRLKSSATGSEATSG